MLNSILSLVNEGYIQEVNLLSFSVSLLNFKIFCTELN